MVRSDVKPEKGVLNQDQLFLSDFGIAKPIDANASPYLTAAGLVVRTGKVYVAPEQADAGAAADPRADIYAFRVGPAYELLTGEPPFVGLSAEGMAWVGLTPSGEPEPIARRRPDLPAALASLIMPGLRKDPAERWDSAEAWPIPARIAPGAASPLPPLVLPDAGRLERARAAYARARPGARRSRRSARPLPPASWKRRTWSGWARRRGGSRRGPACIRARERAYRRYLDRGDGYAAAWMALQLAEGRAHRLARSVAQGWLHRAERHLAELPESVRGVAGSARLHFVVRARGRGLPERALPTPTGRSRSPAGSATSSWRPWRCRTGWRAGGHGPAGWR